MNEQYYQELDPEKRWQILQNEPDSEEKRHAEKLYLLRHRDEKTGKRNVEQDHYLWFLLNLEISGSRRSFFIKSEAKRILKELRRLEGVDVKQDAGAEQISLGDDMLFLLEIRNTASRLFSVSGRDGGRKLFGVAQANEEMRLADQCMDAWRLIYGAPMYLDLEEELRPVSEAVKEAYLAVDSEAGKRLEALDRKKRRREG